ncbi:MAG TPA: HD domain-containing protein [Thermomicrobiaceae bacterium]|nr:HD domain-containing protein [Thermomicrobiaceae bacterium]
MACDWDAIIDLLGYAGALKRLPRGGWVQIGVAAPESVADHSYRVALLTLLLASGDARLDLTRALILALVHDLPEAIAGDRTPFDEALAAGVGDRDRDALIQGPPAFSPAAARAKQAAEAAALRRITAGLPEPLAALIGDAWQEYEADATPEARLVHQADKLEALLQGFEYRELEARPGLPLASFEAGTRAALREPAPRALLAAMLARFGGADTTGPG